MIPRAYRVVILCAAMSVLLFIFGRIIFRLLGASWDEPRIAAFVLQKAKGERLTFGNLKANERIVIEHLSIRHGASRAWTFIYDGNVRSHLIVTEHEVNWEPNLGITAGKVLWTDSLDLSEGYSIGLDVYLSSVRELPKTKNNYYDTYRIEYFRDGREIGEEFLIDWIISQEEYFADSKDEIPDRLRGYVTYNHWSNMMSFRSLVARWQEWKSKQSPD